MTWEPACMEPDELEAWRAGRAAACEACPLGFALEMRALGRCNGTPAGSEEVTNVMVARLTITAPPCDTCGHAPVCRIREQVLDLSRFTVVAPDDAPELDRALTVVASATVECSHYQRARNGQSGKGGSAKGRTLNLSPEERQRRRQQALDLTARRAEARKAQVPA